MDDVSELNNEELRRELLSEGIDVPVTGSSRKMLEKKLTTARKAAGKRKGPRSMDTSLDDDEVSSSQKRRAHTPRVRTDREPLDDSHQHGGPQHEGEASDRHSPDSAGSNSPHPVEPLPTVPVYRGETFTSFTATTTGVPLPKVREVEILPTLQPTSSQQRPARYDNGPSTPFPKTAGGMSTTVSSVFSYESSIGSIITGMPRLGEARPPPSPPRYNTPFPMENNFEHQEFVRYRRHPPSYPLTRSSPFSVLNQVRNSAGSSPRSLHTNSWTKEARSLVKRVVPPAELLFSVMVAIAVLLVFMHHYMGWPEPQQQQTPLSPDEILVGKQLLHEEASSHNAKVVITLGGENQLLWNGPQSMEQVHSDEFDPV